MLHKYIDKVLRKSVKNKNKLIPADLYIVNTCAVTAEAEKKSRQMSSRIYKLNPNYAESDYNKYLKILIKLKNR